SAATTADAVRATTRPWKERTRNAHPTTGQAPQAAPPRPQRPGDGRHEGLLRRVRHPGPDPRLRDESADRVRSYRHDAPHHPGRGGGRLLASGSTDRAPRELDGFENSRLADGLRKAKEELFNLRFQSATGQLEAHGRVRAVKRDIARIYTVMRERELGIRAT